MDIVFICMTISAFGLLIASIKNSVDNTLNRDLLLNLQKQIDIVWERVNLQDEYITRSIASLQEHIDILAKHTGVK